MIFAEPMGVTHLTEYSGYQSCDGISQSQAHPGTFGTLVLPRSKIPLSPPVHYWVSKIMTNNFYLLAEAQKPPPTTTWPPQSMDFFSIANEMAASLSILPPWESLVPGKCRTGSSGGNLSEDDIWLNSQHWLAWLTGDYRLSVVQENDNLERINPIINLCSRGNDGLMSLA